MSNDDTSFRVICADDQPDIVMMLRMLVDRQPDMQCILAATDAQEVVDFLSGAEPATADDPIIVLLDLTMPGLDPLDALRRIHATHDHVRVLVYSGYDEAQYGDEVIEAGAWGMMSKDKDFDLIVDSVRRVGRGEFITSQQAHRNGASSNDTVLPAPSTTNVKRREA